MHPCIEASAGLLSIATLLALVAFSGGVSPLAQEVSE